MTPRLRLSPDEIASSGSLDESPQSKNGMTGNNGEADMATSSSEAARDRHDIFNLVALFPMVSLMFINWDFDKFMSGHGAEASWSGEYFMFMWTATIAYFFFDLLWVARVPSCVKSPGIIIKHHIGAMVYLWGPVLWPEFQWFMGVILSVEINTWFLIARRVLYKRKGSTPRLLTDMVTLLFYTSWIIIRCVVFPLVLMVMLSKAWDHLSAGNPFHFAMAFIPLHFFFCLLNLKWSYELFTPIVKKWWNQDTTSVKIASGL